MGRHQYAGEAERAAPDEWEESPPTAPLWRARIVTSAVLLLAVVAGTWWAVGWLTSPTGPTGASAPVAVPVSPAAPAEDGQDGQGGEEQAEVVPDGGSTGPAETVTVHVAGEVAEPGLVVLPTGARVQDAVRAAGGPTEDAAVDRLNLAAPAVDGSQILVPGAGEEPVPGQGTGSGPVLGGPDGAGGVGGGVSSVNLNTADSASLEQLPGIGPALAGRIIDHREQVGPFGSLEDLDAVSGIGPAMMERLDGLVSW